MRKHHKQWKELYEKLAGPDWPACPLELDFNKLPKWVQDELIAFGYEPNPYQLKVFKTRGQTGYKVFYLDGTDGGGVTHGQDYIDIIKTRYPGRKFTKCYEWCAGPGFIGYTILDHALCESLCLTDIHNPALECAEETAYYNQLENKVSIHLLKDLALLPEDEKFDLVVSNPPHAEFFAEEKWYGNLNRLTTDVNWEAHKNFFSNIKKHLLPDGVILLQENHAGSTVETFQSMIEDAGLVITDSFNSSKYYDSNNDGTYPIIKIYYIEIKSK